MYQQVAFDGGWMSATMARGRASRALHVRVPQTASTLINSGTRSV